MTYRVTYKSRAGFICYHPTVFESLAAAEQGIRTLRAVFGARSYKIRES